MIIYKIVNNINGKVYIGQTIQPLNKRIRYHLWCNKTPIQKALQKYGINNFSISVIDMADTKTVLNEKEQYWIRATNSKFPSGYNLTDGGEGLVSPSEEIRRKIGEKSKGRKWSEEQKMKHSASRKGHPVSDKVRETASKINKGKKFSAERCKQMSDCRRGKKLSEAHRLKIIKALTGRKCSEETRKKIGMANKKKRNEEQ